MKKLLPVFAVLMLLAASQADAAPAAKSGPQTSANRVGIAAVVNEDIVTFSDINDRLKLLLQGSPGVPPDDVRREMEFRTLNRLIDEKLQLQEAKSLDIVVNEDQIQAAFATIAQQNNLPAEEFKRRLVESGLPIDTLYDQIRAEIAWGQVARRKLRPQINISESEIDSEIIAMKNAPPPVEAPAAAAPAPAGTMVHLKQLVIMFEPKDSEQIINAKIQRALSLKGEIKNCAAMDKKMAEFKNRGTADLGKGPLDGLPPPLKTAVQNLKVGELSMPVRGQNGVAVLMVCERQEPQQAAAAPAAPAPETAPAAPAMTSATASTPIMADGAAPPALPAETAEGEQAVVGPVAPPTATEIQRDDVANRLGLKRIQQMQERYLRDLRATAFIDKRI